MGKKGSQLGTAIHKMFDMSQEKWFVSWQTKEVERVEPDPLPSARRNNDSGGGAPGTNTSSAELQPVEAAAAAAAAGSTTSSNGAVVNAATPSSSSTSQGAPKSVGLRLFCFPWEGASPSVFEALSWQVGHPTSSFDAPPPLSIIPNAEFVFYLHRPDSRSEM